MEILAGLFDLVVHLDRHLGDLIRDYGMWTYPILFGIIFSETGLVVTPILPGDSLLFIAGTFAALGNLNIHLLVSLLVLAAVLGNTCNYAIGRYLGPRLFKDQRSRWLNPRYLERTHAFYEKYGGLAVVISRFIPIVRTYVPFVAGLGAMSYARFTAYNVFGALAWVLSITYLGYFFGVIPWVRENQGLIIVAIIVASVLPVFVGFIRARTGRPS
jgi:membrane-associated protein